MQTVNSQVELFLDPPPLNTIITLWLSLFNFREVITLRSKQYFGYLKLTIL